MGEKGLNVLQSAIVLSNENIEISFVIGAQDKNLNKDFYIEIKELSISNGIFFIDRENENNNLKCDYRFAISWRWLINDFENLIVFHDSILPKYRGFNPLVTALINGDKEIGASAIYANKEFDKGDILGQEITSINYPIKINESIKIISKLYTKLFENTIQNLLNNSVKPIKQDEKYASYSLWRDDEDYQINWNDKAIIIKRKIDAIGFPYNGAFTFYDNKKIIINETEVVDDLNIINRDSGKILQIIDNCPIIVCKTGLLKITDAIDFETKEKITFNKLRIKLK